MKLKEAYSKDEFLKQLKVIGNLIASQIDTSKVEPEQLTYPGFDTAKLRRKWTEIFATDNSIESILNEVVIDSTKLHSPNFMGHQVSAPLPLAALIEALSAYLNNGMAIYEMGPAATFIEKLVVEQVAKLVGYTANAGGIFTSGGSIGNFTALLAARQNKLPGNVWQNGYANLQPAVMVSEQAHYSIARAVQMMGMGESAVIKLPTDENFRVKTTEFERIYAEETKNGKFIFAIIGSACTTSTGTHDKLIDFANFAQKHNLWFHVDAAHGGGALFSSKYKKLLQGIELADSVVIDFHKMLLMPALATAVLYKSEVHSYEVFSQKADYILSPDSLELDYAHRTLECTKHMITLKIFIALKVYGEEIFEEFVDKTYDLAREFYRIILEEPNFEAAHIPESNIFCFRYLPSNAKSDAEISEFQIRIRTQLLENGNYYIVKTVLNGKVYLRVTLMNPFTESEHIIALINFIKSIANKLNSNE